MSETPPKTLNEITLAHSFQLEELLDSAALSEMTHSFEVLFGVPLRVYSSAGILLADAIGVPAVYSVMEKTPQGRRAVQNVIDQVRKLQPQKAQSATMSCVTGASYLVSAVEHDGRIMGRIILGPYVSPDLVEPPSAAYGLMPEEQHSEFAYAWSQLARVSDEKVVQLDAHVRATLDLLIFSGLKAYLASNMHLASVQESFRELSEKNRKLQLTYERLKELDRLKSNFLATVSHELRTPLTSIIGYSEMMLEGISGELTVEQHEFLGTIHEKGEQLLELIKSLLDLSKLESGTMSLRRAATDCGQLVEEVVRTLSPSARKRDVQLRADVQSDLPSLLADADRLRQVLNNLTENALKFTPASGKVTVSVRRTMAVPVDWGGMGGAVFAAPSRPAIEFRVSDTGIGIPEDERSRVFDAFYQVDSSSTREVGGTGLGLSIVKRLVDAHDGVVYVEANEPQGAVFVVTLPINER